MKRQALDVYDCIPNGQKRYLSNYGWHFTTKACDYAVSLMRKMNTASGKMERIDAMSQEQLSELMKKYGIVLDNNIMADGLYVANMCKADYYKKSVPDEQHLAMFVKDTIDDADASDGNIMRKWYASMVGMGVPVDWEEIL